MLTTLVKAKRPCGCQKEELWIDRNSIGSPSWDTFEIWGVSILNLKILIKLLWELRSITGLHWLFVLETRNSVTKKLGDDLSSTHSVASFSKRVWNCSCNNWFLVWLVEPYQNHRSIWQGRFFSSNQCSSCLWWHWLQSNPNPTLPIFPKNDGASLLCKGLEQPGKSLRSQKFSYK